MADEAGVEGSGARGAPRIVTANRAQLQLRPQDLESLLPADHRARALWMVVDRLDLSRFYAAIQARGAIPAGRRSIRRCWSRSASTPRVRAWEARGSWRDCASGTMRTGGCVAGSA